MLMGSAPGEPGALDDDRTVVWRMSDTAPCGCGPVFRGGLPAVRLTYLSPEHGAIPADEDATDRSGSGMFSCVTNRTLLTIGFAELISDAHRRHSSEHQAGSQ
jgi:hypothetical protein